MKYRAMLLLSIALPLLGCVAWAYPPAGPKWREEAQPPSPKVISVLLEPKVVSKIKVMNFEEHRGVTLFHFRFHNAETGEETPYGGVLSLSSNLLITKKIKTLGKQVVTIKIEEPRN